MLSFSIFYENVKAAQYDGTNTTDVRAYIESVCGNGTTAMSGTIITNPVAAVHVGDWVVQSGATFVVLSGAAFSAANSSPVEPVQIALGSAAIPTLIASQSTAVAVTIKPAMPDTNYQAYPVVTAGGLTLLGTLQPTAVVITDEDTVTVTVQNTGLLSVAGGVLVVQAIHN